MYLKKILSKLRMYVLNFDGKAIYQPDPTVNIPSQNKLPEFPCALCGAPYTRKRKSQHIRLKVHQDAIHKMISKREELLTELRKIKLLLNSP